MRNLVFVITSAITISLIPRPAAAQASGLNEDPCVVNPKAPSGGSLTEQLDNCNGVLAPPKVGDDEIVEPAPEGGTLKIIPPSGVPEQSHGVTERHEPAAGGEVSYDIGEIAGAIARSATTAQSLSLLKSPDVEVRDISILLTASNAAVLNASIREHADALDTLRKSISDNPALAAAVTGAGLFVQGIVAAQIRGENSVTLFGR